MVQRVARVSGRAMLTSERSALTEFATTYDAVVSADVQSRYRAALRRKQDAARAEATPRSQEKLVRR